MKKRLLSLLLCIVMVLSLFPAVSLPALAADDTDAFGIKMDTTMTDEEKKLKNNPFGTDDWFTLFSVKELSVASFGGGSGSFSGYNYNVPGEQGAISNPVRTGSDHLYTTGAGNLKLVDTAACDPIGEGQQRYTAVLGYYDKRIYLYLLNENGNKVGSSITFGASNDDLTQYLNEVNSYASNSYLSVTAGDFDGDGKDSLVIYLPYMEKDHPYVYEYQISEGGIDGSSQRSVDSVWDLTGTRDTSKDNDNDDKVVKNTPMIQLVAADTDRDNVEELVITANVGNTSANGITDRSSKLYIYDLHGTRWQQSHSETTDGYSAGIQDGKRLRWASSSVGNVIMDNGVTDYPEIITAGWVDKNGEDGDDMTDVIGSYLTRCTGVRRGEDGVAVGSYTSTAVSAILNYNGKDEETKEATVSKYYNDGHKEDDNQQALVNVTVFAAKGPMYASSVLIGDTVYSYNNGWEYVFRNSFFNRDEGSINGYLISNAGVIESIAGNFAGYEDGREQAVFATLQKQSGPDRYFIKLYTYQLKPEIDKESGQIIGDTYWGLGSFSGDYISYHAENAVISLATPDTDNDSTIVKIKEVTKTYTEPGVLAILEAPPYFAEVDGGDTGNSETVYGTGKTTGEGTTTSNGMKMNIMAGFEWELGDVCGGFTCGIGFEANTEMNYTWETTEESSVTYELTYSNDTGENQVIVYRRPVLAYLYEVKGSKATMRQVKEGSLATSMVTVDEYNAAAALYNLDPIADGTIATEGDPFSYRSTTGGLTDVVTAEDWGQYNSGGTVTQSLTNEETYQQSYTYDLNVSVSVYGSTFGVKAGIGLGYTHSDTGYSIDTTSITKAGAVTGNRTEGYDFQWQFAHWTTPINGSDVPVLGYVLGNLQAPPSPPVNLSASEVTPYSAVLNWEAGNRSADAYYIYQYFDTSGNYVQVGEVDGTETSFAVSNLTPATTFRYVVRAYAASRPDSSVNGLSVPSEELAVTTAPEGVTPIDITSPRDASARVGGTASFTVGVELPSADYSNVAYQWQSKTGFAAWSKLENETQSTLRLTDVQTEQDGANYRCQIVALFKGNPIYYYSDAATLHVGRDEVTAALSVTDAAGGSGTRPAPYTGDADYQKQIGTTTTPVTANVAVYTSGENALPVYSIGTAYYAMDAATGTYYQVTKSGDSYTTGDALTATDAVYITDVLPASTVLSLPEGFSPNAAPVNKVENDTTYTLKAALTGTEQTPDGLGLNPTDSRLATVTGTDYYWYSDGVYYAYGADGAVGAVVTPTSAEGLFDVYVMDAVFGREETYTAAVTETGGTTYESETDYWFTYVDTGAACPFRAETVTGYTVGGTPVEGFAPAALTPVTRDTTETIEVPVYTTESGTRLTLSAAVRTINGSDPVANLPVNFRIVNLQTRSVTPVTATTDSNGTATATWRAPSAALYSISAVTQLSNSYAVSDMTAPLYYQASPQTVTEYRLVFEQNGQTLETVPFGRLVSPKLQSRTQKDGAWEAWTDTAIAAAVIRAAGTTTNLAGMSYAPESAGFYQFVAENAADSELAADPQLAAGTQLATGTLEVTRIPVTVTPIWTVNTIPAAADDVTLVAAGASLTDLDLKKVFNINCPYFSGNEPGRYAVSLSYKTGESDKAAVEAFKNNYVVTLRSDEFMVQPNSATVRFRSGENGAIVGRYADNQFIMASGSSRTTGQKLTFRAAPNAGFAVDVWIINGEEYQKDAPLPDGFALSTNGQSLVVASFDAVGDTVETANGQGRELTVEVLFRTDSNAITYSVAGDSTGNGSLSAVSSKNGSAPLSLLTGQSVSLGTDVTLTAAPGEGFVVDHWTVNGSTYTREDGTTPYTAKELKLEGVEQSYNVTVSFKAMDATFAVSAAVTDQDGAPDASRGVITVTDADTHAVIAGDDLTTIAENTSLTFSVAVSSATTQMVMEWQTSTDGVLYTTVPQSGAQNAITLYNLTEETDVRVLVTTTQTHGLSWNIVLQSGGDVPADAEASVAAASNGQPLTAGPQSAYIPVSFALSLNDAYEVVGWSGATQSEADPKQAAIAGLTQNTVVTVTIEKKPVITWDTPVNGSVTVTGTVNGTEETALASGGYVDRGTGVTVLLQPAKGYAVDGGITAAYTDGTGDTTDDKTYTIANVQENTAVTPAFAALAQKSVSYSVVDVNDDGVGDGGTLAAAFARKNMTSYTAQGVNGAITAYDGGGITLTATPHVTYVVKQWKINGVIRMQNGTADTAETLTLTYAELGADPTVTVQFVSGAPFVTFADPANGTLTAESAGARFTSGGQTAAPVAFTATPDEHYEVQEWTANGTVAAGETGNTFTYTPSGRNARVAVVLRGKQMSISAAAGAGGSAAVSPTSVRYGDTVTLTATPSIGFDFAGWYLSDSLIDGAGAEYSFTAEADAAYEARFTPAQPTVTFTVNNAGMGSVAAKVGGSAIQSGDEVSGGKTVTFTARPLEGYRVKQWSDNVTPAADKQTATATVPTGGLEVVVTLEAIPTYTITLNSTVHGSISATVGGQPVTEVPEGTEVTFTATAEKYHMFVGWTGDAEGQTAASFTVAVMKDLTVGAKFDEAVHYTVQYSVVGGNGTAFAHIGAADGESITIDTEATALGGSKLLFTAAPATNYMVKAWTLNGDAQDNLSNTLIIDALSGNTVVTVEYETPETLYDIPQSKPGYTVGDVVRTPDDYGIGTGTDGADQIRRGGTVTFTVTPTNGQDITTLKVNDIDCLTTVTQTGKDDLLTVVDNGDGSFTVTVTNVTKHITMTALQIMTETEALNEVPEELEEQFEDVQELQSALRLEVAAKDSKAATKLYDITLKYSTDGGVSWSPATPEFFPAGGIPVHIDYADLGEGVNNSYTFTVIHMFTTDMNGQTPGETETLTVTKDATGISFTAYSLSPFAIGWSKATPAPVPGGPVDIFTGYTVTLETSGSGKVTASADEADEGETIELTVKPDDGHLLTSIKAFGESGERLRHKKTDEIRTFVMPAENVTVKSEFTAWDNPFIDVNEPDWFYEDVGFVNVLDMMLGTSETTFKPGLTTTRGMIVTILYRLEGEPKVAGSTPFTDVTAGRYYEKAIAWAAGNGIVDGYGDGLFGPEDLITREQMAAVMYRYARFKEYDVSERADLSRFSDSGDASAYAETALSWANAMELVTGVDEVTLDPRGNATRAQAAAILHRFCEFVW